MKRENISSLESSYHPSNVFNQKKSTIHCFASLICLYLSRSMKCSEKWNCLTVKLGREVCPNVNVLFATLMFELAKPFHRSDLDERITRVKV